MVRCVVQILKENEILKFTIVFRDQQRFNRSQSTFGDIRFYFLVQGLTGTTQMTQSGKYYALNRLSILVDFLNP